MSEEELVVASKRSRKKLKVDTSKDSLVPGHAKNNSKSDLVELKSPGKKS